MQAVTTFPWQGTIISPNHILVSHHPSRLSFFVFSAGPPDNTTFSVLHGSGVNVLLTSGEGGMHLELRASRCQLTI